MFVMLVSSALFLMAGLVIDGGAQVAGNRRAEHAAAAAARAAVDASATGRVAGKPVDRAAVVRAAGAHVPEGLTAVVTVMADNRVRVELSGSVETMFVSVMGIATLPVSGTAEAQLVAPGA